MIFQIWGSKKIETCFVCYLSFFALFFSCPNSWQNTQAYVAAVNMDKYQYAGFKVGEPLVHGLP